MNRITATIQWADPPTEVNSVVVYGLAVTMMMRTSVAAG